MKSMNLPMMWRWGFAWRPWNRGFSIQWDRPKYFSERYGYRRVYRLGRWSVTFFPPRSRHD